MSSRREGGGPLNRNVCARPLPRSLVYDGDTAHVRHTKGLTYLSRLLARPDAAVHVLDLVGGTAAAADSADGDAAVDRVRSERARLTRRP
jgi:hypothetical protein